MGKKHSPEPESAEPSTEPSTTVPTDKEAAIADDASRKHLRGLVEKISDEINHVNALLDQYSSA